MPTSLADTAIGVVPLGVVIIYGRGGGGTSLIGAKFAKANVFFISCKSNHCRLSFGCVKSLVFTDM